MMTTLNVVEYYKNKDVMRFRNKFNLLNYIKTQFRIFIIGFVAIQRCIFWMYKSLTFQNLKLNLKRTTDSNLMFLKSFQGGLNVGSNSHRRTRSYHEKNKKTKQSCSLFLSLSDAFSKKLPTISFCSKVFLSIYLLRYPNVLSISNLVLILHKVRVWPRLLTR